MIPHPPPLSLYVHIPWCVRKCPYCDFNSHEQRGEIPEGEYVAALVADLEASLPDVWGRRVTSIFIGGGTPSLFKPSSIDHLLTAIRTRIPVNAEAEITMEANPGTFEAERFRGYHEAGINRLSIGVQSFDDAKLAAIGRIHGGDEARRAVESALEVFGNVNVDLMYALPAQSAEESAADVGEAIARGAPHISAYHLTLEPGTPFHRNPPAVPDHDRAADMQDALEAAFANGGYEHYETSAFAKAGFRSRHNLNYWNFGDYLGIGAGAHAKITSLQRVRREMRIRQPDAYMRASLSGKPMREARDVDEAELPFEFMLNALRLVEGFPVALFTERTGLSILAVEAQMAEAERIGLIERDHEWIRPTPKGRRFLNELLERFIPGETAAKPVIPIASTPSRGSRAS
jgi:putative oxygen-independent coproporphyrinogen III oxidase